MASQRIKFTSPKGTFGFPCAISEADTHFADSSNPDDKGDYKARLLLPEGSSEAVEFQRKLEMIFADHVKESCQRMGKKICKTDLEFIENTDFHEAVAEYVEDFSSKKGKSPNRLPLEEDNVPWGWETDKEGELTGKVMFRAKLKARVVPKNGKEPFDQRPKVFNASNVLLSEVPSIGTGTIGILAGQVALWATSKIGMTLWLEAVKVLELVEGQGGQTADGYGFGDETGSYTDANEFEAALEFNGSGDF